MPIACRTGRVSSSPSILKRKWIRPPTAGLSRPAGAPDFVKPYRLKLDTTDVPAEGICKDFVSSLKAFRLTLTEAAGKPVERVLHDDAGKVPSSRRCVTGYRIGGAVTYMRSTSTRCMW